MGIIKPIVITFLSILALAYFVPSISYENWATLIIASIVLTLLQKLVRPILTVLFLPFNIITLGLFAWLINVLILWLALVFVPGFHIDQVTLGGMHFGSFMSLVVVSFALSLIQAIIEFVF
jgi:putative membrane protein